MSGTVVPPPFSRRSIAQTSRRERERLQVPNLIVKDRIRKCSAQQKKAHKARRSRDLELAEDALVRDRFRSCSANQHGSPLLAQMTDFQLNDMTCVPVDFPLETLPQLGSSSQSTGNASASTIAFARNHPSLPAEQSRQSSYSSSNQVAALEEPDGLFNVMPEFPIFVPSSNNHSVVLTYEEASHNSSFDPIPIVEQDRNFLGSMSVPCQYCAALHWLDEELTKSTATNHLFGMCCLQGKIRLPLLSPLPSALMSLYQDSNPLANSFRQNIRSYNASNALTSLGVTMDDRILQGNAPTSFTIHGSLHHRIGSLLPTPGIEPSYAQLYIYDADTALQYRQQRNPHLRSDVLSIINTTLLESNELCKLYKHAYEVLSENASRNNEVPVSLHYTPGTDPRRYNLPSTNEIAVILPGRGNCLNTTRDIVLRLRSGPLHRISDCHPAY